MCVIFRLFCWYHSNWTYCRSDYVLKIIATNKYNLVVSSKMSIQHHFPIFVFTIIPSTSLLKLIAKYHKEKPPGLQTILDLMVLDSVNLFHAFNASTALVFFIIEMANFYAQLIQLLFSNCLVLFLASLQVSQFSCIVSVCIGYIQGTFNNKICNASFE